MGTHWFNVNEFIAELKKKLTPRKRRKVRKGESA